MSKISEEGYTNKLYAHFSKLKNVTISTVSDTGEVKRFYTTKIPKLKVSKNNSLKDIEVTVSSVQEEDTALLHYLLQRTKYE